MTDQFNIEFKQPEQKYAFALPPTVYEFLWRLEYIQMKHTVSIDNTLTPMSHQNQQQYSYQHGFYNIQQSSSHARDVESLGPMQDVISQSSMMEQSDLLRRKSKLDKRIKDYGCD